MEQVLIDTDVIIDFLRGFEKRVLEIFQKIENREIKPTTTILNIVELYSGKDIEYTEKLLALEKILSYFHIIDLELNGAKLAGKLRSKYGLGLPDAVIAACAIRHKVRLSTLNKKDFRRIKELKLYET